MDEGADARHGGNALRCVSRCYADARCAAFAFPKTTAAYHNESCVFYLYDDTEEKVEVDDPDYDLYYKRMNTAGGDEL